MSRRASSSAPRSAISTSAPYPRRTAGQPKSSRQQFSACGACRMRRVRCDLKDLPPITTPNGLQSPPCSNCSERSIKCVDEFAQVKAVKLLRRGRRLQQVEAVYGKVTDDASAMSTSVPYDPASSTTLSAANSADTHSPHIPQLQLEFLRSPFFRRFCVQRPIIEPSEFSARYIAHVEGTKPLNVEGKMIAMLLVIWAASLGVNEFGAEEDPDPASSGSPQLSPDGDDDLPDPQIRARVLRTESMVREILTLVDVHGILRRPSWDGVRALLLLLPLTRSIQSSLERQTTYEATLSQVYSLCSVRNPPSIDSGLGPYCDALVRARIFWYAHIHEGVTAGLRGGRLILDDDDLLAFQRTLPPQYCASAINSMSPGAESSHSSTSSSPVTPTFPFSSLQDPIGQSRSTMAYLVTCQFFSLALRVSRASRAVHSTLTGPRACRRIESGVAIREESLVEIWDDLERCWEEFEGLRRNASGFRTVGGSLFRGEDVECFVSGWQIFIFESFNVIREALQRYGTDDRASPSDHLVPAKLHISALRRCRKLLPGVMDILKRHLTVPSNFFAHDAGLIHDGCFFAGVLLARSDELNAGDMLGWDLDWDDGLEACIQALEEIRWVYSHSRQREKTLRAEWNARIKRDSSRQSVQQTFPIKQSPGHSPNLTDITPLPSNSTSRSLSLVAAGGQVRPLLPPLSISFSHVESGPNTGLTDGSSSWRTYTPPTTSGSMTGTVATHRSLSPPSVKSIQPPVKNEESMFGGLHDVDPFSFSVEDTTNTQNPVEAGIRSRWPSYNEQSNHFIDASIMLATSDVVLGRASDDGCPHFGSDCPAYYH